MSRVNRKKWNINTGLAAQAADYKSSLYFTITLLIKLGKMRLNQVVFLSLLGFAAAAPAPDGLDSASAVVDADFKPDWDAFAADFKLALEESKADPILAKRLNTESSGNVAFGQAVYAAGSAAVTQLKGLKNWNKVLNNAFYFLPLRFCCCFCLYITEN